LTSSYLSDNALQSMALNTVSVLWCCMCTFVEMNRKLLCRTGTTLMAVCLTLGLLMWKPLPDQFHNGGRILTANDTAHEVVPTENASDTAIGSLPQGKGIPLQAPENVSSPRGPKGWPWGPKGGRRRWAGKGGWGGKGWGG